MTSCRRPSGSRGLTLAETLATVAALLILLAIAVPSLGRARGIDDATGSLANLALHGFGHAAYAGDWNGRQFTPTPDDLSQYGLSVQQAVQNPALIYQVDYMVIALGWGGTEEGAIAMWGFWVIGCCQNATLLQPIDFPSVLGRFRVPNGSPLHDYIDGRFYGEAHYAPGDGIPIEFAQSGLESPYAFTSVSSNGPAWSSYCLSAAALYSPDVFRAPSEGGWQNPFHIDDGMTVPPLAAAAYPNLKTLVMEHNWVRGAPSPISPKMPSTYGAYGNVNPWQYNHGIDAEPAALFYDGSVRILPNAEVQASDQIVLQGSGGIDGVWSRDTPLGSTGYRNDLAVDPIVNVSHHVLTTDGILGRDTIGPLMPGLSMPRLEPRPVSLWSLLTPLQPELPDVEDAPWLP